MKVQNDSRGLKPVPIVGRDVRAEARTYLRSKGNAKSKNNGNTGVLRFAQNDEV